MRFVYVIANFQKMVTSPREKKKAGAGQAT